MIELSFVKRLFVKKPINEEYNLNKLIKETVPMYLMDSKPTGPVTIKALLNGFYHNMVYKKSGRNPYPNK